MEIIHNPYLYVSIIGFTLVWLFSDFVEATNGSMKPMLIAISSILFLGFLILPFIFCGWKFGLANVIGLAIVSRVIKIILIKKLVKDKI